MKKVLIADDEKDIRNLLSRILELEGYSVIRCDTGEQALKQIEKQEIPVAIVDVKLPDVSGVELTKRIKEKHLETEVICFTAFGNVPDGVNAMKNGAFDYLMKGDDNNKIIPVVARAYDKAALQLRITQLEKQLRKHEGFDNIIGKSNAIKKAIELARKVAPTDATILLTGETGTGKEVFAHAIHAESPRNKEAFVALNCSAFSRDLLESELFGHKAGAFTNATRDKKGLMEEAHNGTLFLDEIGEMDANLQAKMLRVLETGAFIKVGNTRETKVNVRIVAATHRNLEAEIESGHFREDLYYRLAGFNIHLPSLDERTEDIPLLAEHFAQAAAAKNNKRISGLSGEYVGALQHHRWKGNIRELKNTIERSVILTDKQELTCDSLPFAAQRINGDYLLTLSEMEALHIKKVLSMSNGNKTKAARVLGIGLTTLYRKLEEYGI